MSENYSLQPGVLLSDELKRRIKHIADKFFALTNKKIVVTSGTRTAKHQATLLCDKLLDGDTLAIYKNQTAAQEIKHAYDKGSQAGESREQIILAMAAVIEQQISQSIYISAHLREGAIDVRCRDMTETERYHFKQVAQEQAESVLLETAPPHFHIQL